MKKSPLEIKLEEQEMLRLNMLERTSDNDERNRLLKEIQILNQMRDSLEGRRTDKRPNWIETAIKTGVPALTVIILSVFGFASEQLNGNPTGFTLRWLFNRAPR